MNGRKNGLALVHPGEILADDPKALGLSARGLARSIQVPPKPNAKTARASNGRFSR